MPERSLAARRIGTVEGSFGDGRTRVETRNELEVESLPPDPDTGEARVGLVVRAHKPVDTPELRCELPAHTVERAIDALQAGIDG